MPQNPTLFTDEELLRLARASGTDLDKLTPDEWVRLDRLTRPVPAAGPIDPNEPETYGTGAWRGLKEGALGGAMGFLKGLPEAPAAVIRGLGQLVTQNPLTTARDTVRAATRLPAAVRASATDPEGWGRDVGNLTGQTLLTSIAPAVGRGALTPINRLAGKVATSPKLAEAGGGAAGYALGAGVGHPWIGYFLGRKPIGEFIQSAAEDLERLTGGRAPGLTATERAQLIQEGISPAAIDRIKMAVQTGHVAPGQSAGVPPMTDAAYQAATGSPRGSLSLKTLARPPASILGAPGPSGGGPGAAPGPSPSPAFSGPIDPVARALGFSPGIRVLQMKPSGFQALAREKGVAEATTLLNRTGQLPEAWQKLSPAEQRNALATLRGGPRGGLPLEAQRAIDQTLAGMTGAEAKAYLMKAPNPAAYNYILQKIRGQ